MKKVILCSAVCLSSLAAFSQSGEKWATGGNNGSTIDFLGTIKEFPINFRTNNLQRMSLGTNGILNINFLSGTGNRLLQTDASGNIIPFVMGSDNQVLYGNGTWGFLPPPPAAIWQNNNGDIFFNNGYVGIGTNNPQYVLDVYGDVHLNDNLFIGGGIVISDRMHANTDVKTKTLYADSIIMDSTKAIYGKTIISGDTKLKFNLSVTGTSDFLGSVTVAGSQAVGGVLDAQGQLLARQGLTFNDGLTGIKFFPTNGSNPSTVVYGKLSGPPTPLDQCAYPLPNQQHVFDGNIQTYDAANNLSLVLGSDNYQSIIESRGNHGLLVNFYCGHDTYFNTNNSLSNRGGKVFMGEKVSMARYVGVGNNGSAGSIDEGVALNIFANEDNQTGIKLTVWNGTVKPINVVNTDGTENFTVFQNGGIRSKTLAGTGYRSLLVDANGNLVPGQTSSTSSVAWDLGGNTLTNPTAEYLGSQNTDLFIGAGSARMIMKTDGKIGVNETNPIANIQINSGSSPASSILGTPTDDLSSIYWTTNNWSSYGFGMSSSTTENNVGGIFFNINADISGSPTTAPSATPKRIMSFLMNGNSPQVRIGEKRPTAAPYNNMALSVDGGIIAKEIYVRDQQGAQWADYVFNNNYKLMPLEDVEKFIQVNNHLPNVPSACEIEEKGQGIGQLQVVQMEKIEEAFLYILELKKEMETLKKENEKLKQTVEALKK